MDTNQDFISSGSENEPEIPEEQAIDQRDIELTGDAIMSFQKLNGAEFEELNGPFLLCIL